MLQSISTLMQDNIWVAPLAALVAGVLTSLTPCSLSSIPLGISYVGAAEGKNTRRAFWLSLTFALGMALTFTILGTAAALLGRLMSGAGSWWYLVLGTMMLLMALQTWEVFNFIPSSSLLGSNKRRGYVGAMAAGILGGFFSSPCATPVLIALLTLVAGKGSLVWGVFLLLLYSIGHSILVVVAGTSIGFVKTLSKNPKYSTFSCIAKYGMGLVLLLMGFYLFYLGF
jgi:cytochrome c biogenesis protein CcdA